MLSKFSVKKPFTVVVAIILVLILGVVSYTNMSVDLIPSFNLPYAVITTTYAGASPEQVEQAVTAPLEQGMASISNIKEISSVSSENVSMVILEFNEATNMDSAMIEMRENLDRITTYFPDEVGSPTILKINPDMMPILSVAVSVAGMSDAESARYIEDKIIPELKSVEGVASVSGSGLLENMVDVTLTQQKLQSLNDRLASTVRQQAEQAIRDQAGAQLKQQAEQQIAQQKAQLVKKGMTEAQAEASVAAAREKAFAAVESQLDAVVAAQLEELEIPTVNLTREMIQGILSGENLSLPAGSVSAADGASYLVRVGDKIKSVDELKALTLMEIPNFGAVTLSDVAEITSYDNSGTMYSRVNGNYAVILSIQKQPDFSTADVARSLRERTAELTGEYEALRFDLLMDQGEYVDLMIRTIIQNLVVGGLLAVVILVIFLRKIRPTLIVGASIIISVIGAFVLMYFSGITLNMISMSGLALGVGMLVDNSIVVIENIFRLRSEGLSAKEAAIRGAKEVAGAITASTLTTIIVFVPIVFTQGLTRQLFTDLALTIGYSLAASLVVALTLVPAAASTMLRRNFTAKEASSSGKIANGYAKLLGHALNHKWVPITLAVVLLGGSVYAAFSSGTELFPAMDSGSISITVEMPDSYTTEQTYGALDDLSERLTSIPDVDMVGIVDSEGGGMAMMGSGRTVYVQLKDDRTLSTDQVVEEIRSRTEECEYTVSASGSNADLSMLSGGQVVVKITGRELDDLRRSAGEVADMIASVDGTVEIDDGLGKEKQEIRVTVDKDKAIAKGLTVAQVYSAVADWLAAPKSVTTLTDGGLDYAVYVKDARSETATKEKLQDLEITLSDGAKVRVGDVAEVTMSEGFSSIRRTGQERTVSITASVREGYNVGDVNKQIEQKLKDYQAPAGCRVDMGGESESIRETFSDLALMLILGVIFIYLVMVAQFQSLLSPFIVMFTIPLAFTGGFIGLLLTGMPVSVVSLIGLVILVGIVVNNGIVFVDYTNQLMERGYEKREALIQAGRTRVRPILMTALTTIIALTTMAFDTSSGGELMRPMAVTTIGGMIYATILTLFLVPSLYELFRRKKPRRPDEDPDQPSPAPESAQDPAEEGLRNLQEIAAETRQNP